MATAATVGGCSLLNLERIASAQLRTEPYQWAEIGGLFSAAAASDLANTYPSNHLKKITGHDGEKGYEYSARSLVHMGASEPTFADDLSPSWRALAHDFLSPAYRATISRITGYDLSQAALEVNAMHYGPNCWLGPHVDLREKFVTHVFYFNQEWNHDDGGYLKILGSSNADDVVAECMPLIGNSALLVRSETSWHSVARISEGCNLTRRSVNVIFHEPGSVSSMWPAEPAPVVAEQPSFLRKLVRGFRS